MNISEETTTQGAYNLIVQTILAYQRDISDDKEIGMMLSHFGDTITLRLTGISYTDFFVIFIGINVKTNMRCEIVQNINQISFLLTELDKHDNQEPASRLHFVPFPEF